MDIWEGPPSVPKGLDDIVYYKLLSKRYFNNLKSLTWIFIEIMTALLVLGIIWITVDWVKIVVTSIAIAMALVLILILMYIF